MTRHSKARAASRKPIVWQSPKKTRYHPTFMRPVPQTDTRGRVEHTKAHGLTTVKELGKLAL